MAQARVLKISLAETAPSRRMVGKGTVISTMVDPVPPAVDPASSTRSARSRMAGERAWGRLQPGVPDRLAEVPVMGKSTDSARARATGWPGMRIPIFPVPAVSSELIWAAASKTRVRRAGPEGFHQEVCPPVGWM